MKQTKLRTKQIKHNDNISFPVGTALAVKKYTKKLEFEDLFSKFKQKGIPLKNLVDALISYKLSENLSLTRGSDWINRDEVLEEFGLKSFEQKTLYRAIETIGENYQEVILDLQDILFSQYDFTHTDINMDWSSLILWGDKASLARFGYSRDHRPDKKQITFGVSELRKPINIPIGLTIAPGNVNDQTHFQTTFEQVSSCLRKNSLVIFDKGANGKDNLNSVIASKMQFLTAKKLNSSDDKLIKKFWNLKIDEIDAKEGIHGFKQVFPSRTNYFFFSEKLEQENISSALRKAERQLKEAKDIEAASLKGKALPKRFRINNILVNATIEYQTKLKSLSDEQAFELVKKASITGREGFFCLTSSQNLTLKEALILYREKDSVEKIMHSLKNEINIKPLRVWSDNSIYGALLIGYLAHLIISLIRYDEPELKSFSTKFIKISLSNLTVTIEKLDIFRKRRIYSNFDPINELICLKNEAIT
ncbi:MAG: IS1634 family transposase [Nanoarchaeota archaeon]|nr:IS1634 family transposase [Nanoarchaeota archaeon]MBU1854332.1 IS1634 family transposase [Nanoarchaeota archaeon]